MMNWWTINRLAPGLLISGFLLSAITCASGQDLQRYNPNRELIEGIVIPNTELFKIHSEVARRDFLIYVQLPEGYGDNPGKKYPVWYNTDANLIFPLIANASILLTHPQGSVPEMIVIGIGYLDKSEEERAALRLHDFTPVKNPESDRYWSEQLVEAGGRKDLEVRTGGASVFLDFIVEELIPHVESQYRVNPENRSLGGYAMGGIFTLYAMFHQPEIFNHYFAGSPDLDYHDEILFRYESEFAEMHQDLKVSLFMTAGELEEAETVGLVEKMADKLAARGYPNLKLNIEILGDADRRSGVGFSYMRAMQMLPTD